jgi:dienelactone hydrolase
MSFYKMVILCGVTIMTQTATYQFGTAYYPEAEQTVPAVLLIGGSNGKPLATAAQLLAAHGYAAFTLAYFHQQGLPEHLENIPLEQIQQAIHWIKQQPRIDPDRIVLLGYSRGAEFALLFASFFPYEIQGLIAFAPTNMVYGGFPHPNKPAWTFQQHAIIPFIGAVTSSCSTLTEAEDLYNAMQNNLIPMHADSQEDPCVITDLFAARLQAYSAVAEAAEILVEKITCPILLFSGESDAIWPASRSSDRIMQRLDKHQSAIQREHIAYASAGHGFILPYQPTLVMPIFHQIGKFWCKLGGTAEGNIEAHAEAWKKTLTFLSEITSG